MKIFLLVLAGLGLLALIVISGLTGAYNSLVAERTAVETSWAQVETQYQRRFDLVPQLVNSTKAVLVQEQKVFGDIAEARTKYSGSASGSTERVEAANQLEGALARLMVIVENYPVLRSNETVQALMDELTGTSNRITIAQQRYNETVQVYNVHIHSFPSNILAGMWGFTDKPLFKAATGADQAPTVELLNSN